MRLLESVGHNKNIVAYLGWLYLHKKVHRESDITKQNQRLENRTGWLGGPQEYGMGNSRYRTGCHSTFTRGA